MLSPVHSLTLACEGVFGGSTNVMSAAAVRLASLGTRRRSVTRNGQPNGTSNTKETKPPDTALLKARYLECFGARTSNTATLRETVKGLVGQGISRATLIAWAVETGCTKGHASNLLSQILCALGLRKRRAGAGPKPSPEVLKLLAHAQAEYGERHLKILRAAWRAGKAQEQGHRSNNTI